MRNYFSVLKAEDGIKAMEVLDNYYVDLIILDIMMPNMDGYEFAQELRDADCMLPIEL
ncbi:response regulator [Clostridium sp.]|uniref:response regulator n=1 Tax=Clostridium sp. TaxID=1506 RepID=UPI002635AD98|nr:response regulator [Clostridium sp.]